MNESARKVRHLQTFVEVARQKSVVKAATGLHITQPAVTKSIRELEQILGVAVIERDGRGIRITRVLVRLPRTESEQGEAVAAGKEE